MSSSLFPPVPEAYDYAPKPDSGLLTFGHVEKIETDERARTHFYAYGVPQACAVEMLELRAKWRQRRRGA
jgi:hypothetical protein